MKTKVSFLLIAAAVGMALAHPLAAATDSDWPLWSGPNRNLTSLGNGTFDRPSFGLERLWAKTLGSGYSGIAIVGERLVTGFSNGESDFLVALDAATGEERWRYRIGDAYKGHDGSNDGPLATPTIDDGLVYGLSPRGRLFALRLDSGDERWSHDLVEELGARAPLYGFVSAPIVVGGTLVMQTGGDGGHSIAGFDPKTGELLWSMGDDSVTYQSPVAVRIDGEEQVFAVTDRHLFGLAPRTGEVLWQHEHTSGEGGGFQRAQPVLVDETSVLLTDRPASALYRVTKTADGYGADERWRGRALHSNFASPAAYEGYVYGVTGRSFLTCVDPARGETVWKSRPPGGGQLVLVDGHLVILAPSGEVVVAEATPEGYREKARVKALERGSYTRPSFAGGRIYVRNLREIAAVGVADEAPAAAARDEAEPAAELRGAIAELARKLEGAENKRQVIDEFMASHREFPILEGDELVHIIFRGDVEDLMLAGNMSVWEREVPMHRLGSTDFYFRSMDLEPGGRFEYAFAVFDETRLDPLNPRKSTIGDRERSLLTTRGWREPAHLRESEAERGRIEKRTWRSEILGDEREVQVYLPPGYDESADRYPLLLVQNGDEALKSGLMDRTLDNLIGKSVAPLVVAFMPQGHFTELGSRAPEYAQAIAEELIPLLDSDYRTVARPEARAVVGTSFTGWMSFYLVFERPGLFHKAATQSAIYGNDDPDMLLQTIEKHEMDDQVDLDFYINWTPHEFKDQEGRFPGRLLAETLEKQGFKPVTQEVAGGSGWGSWRQTTDRVLEALFPLK
ncbi:MAG: PQQ-binding-like beta-propeller repeat protein [bacterium]|nr:PQQ-binding-like beta-propeller repeat protein [bacterium]